MTSMKTSVPPLKQNEPPVESPKPSTEGLFIAKTPAESKAWSNRLAEAMVKSLNEAVKK